MANPSLEICLTFGTVSQADEMRQNVIDMLVTLEGSRWLLCGIPLVMSVVVSSSGSGVLVSKKFLTDLIALLGKFCSVMPSKVASLSAVFDSLEMCMHKNAKVTDQKILDQFKTLTDEKERIVEKVKIFFSLWQSKLEMFKIKCK